MSTGSTLLKMGSLITNDATKTEELKDIKKITLRQFRHKKYNNCSTTQEANNGRNDTNSITSVDKSNIDKDDKIPNKVENNEIIVISDDEDALETLKRDVTENIKPSNNEIIELSDDDDPLKIVNNVSNCADQLQREEYTKEELLPNYSECVKPIIINETSKNEELQLNSENSNELSFKKLKTEESLKQVVEYSNNNTEFSEVELVPNLVECLKPITTNEMLSRNEELQSNIECSNGPSSKKPKTEESLKQVADYNNNTEFSKVELVPNSSECLKIISTNETFSKNLQSNIEYSNIPSSFKNPNADEAPKQDEYDNTECSKRELIFCRVELAPNYSECLKSITTNEMSKTEDLQSNSEYSNEPSYKKLKTEESSKQDVEYNNNNAEFSKVELVPNLSECLKPITSNEMLTKNEDLQFNSEYSNEPSFTQPKEEEALKHDVEYNSTECSKEELVSKYSESPKPINTHEILSKNEDLQSNIEYSNEPSDEKLKTEESSKQDVEYNNNNNAEFSKVELVPNLSECLKPITTNEMMTKNEERPSNVEYSNEPSYKKLKTEESSKQDVEYNNNNAEFSKVELVPNLSECLKPITSNEMLTKNEDLQFNSEYSNEPSFTQPKEEEALKQDVEYYNTEWSNRELVPKYSESPKPINTNEILSKNEDLQSNIEYSNEPSDEKLKTEESSKQDVEYNNNNAEFSKVELVPNLSECLKPITTNEMLTKNEEHPSNVEYSNELSDNKLKAEESSKQDVEYNNNSAEFSKVELVLNLSECLKPITTNEMLTKNEDLQFNSEYANEPSFTQSNEEEAPKHDVEYNSTECSKEELVSKYSECLKPTTKMLSKNEDPQTNSAYLNTLPFKKLETEETPKGVEYNNTECSNEHTIKNTSIKNERPIEELLFNNSECVKMIDTIELSTKDLQPKNDNMNVSATNTDEFLKQDPDLNNNKCLNELAKIDTNEFTITSLSLDDYCEGYNSSDFEFIDEDEAKKCPNFLSSLDAAFEKVTVNTAHKFKQPQKVNVNKRAAPIKKAAANKKRATISKLEIETFSENADIENPTSKNPKANPVLDENENINADAMNLCSEDNEILYDYLQSLQTPTNEQFNTDYRDTRRIPNNEQFLHLFSGMYSPYPMCAFGANKEISCATEMVAAFQGVGFDMNRFVDDSTPELRQQAKDTEMKILTKYSTENRPRRRRSRRF